MKAMHLFRDSVLLPIVTTFIFFAGCSTTSKIDAADRSPARAIPIAKPRTIEDDKAFIDAAHAKDMGRRTRRPHVGHWIKPGIRKASIDDFNLQHSKIIALTFDDGPGPGTAAVLKMLADFHIEATFFVLGKNASENPNLLISDRFLRSDGMQNIVGNHSYDHPDFTTLTDKPDEIFHQIYDTHQIIKSTLDYISVGEMSKQSNGVFYFRAPFGNWSSDDTVDLDAAEMKFGTQAKILDNYYGPIEWDIGGRISCSDPVKDAKDSSVMCGGQQLLEAADWDCWDNHFTVDECATGYFNQIVSLENQGGVILSHDIFPETAELWRNLIPRLQALGYKFVRLDKIHSMNQVHIHKIVHRPKNHRPHEKSTVSPSVFGH
jgi:peptidoglycan/xylan/chitin deacetylase (PgdA/CDA1 family)